MTAAVSSGVPIEGAPLPPRPGKYLPILRATPLCRLHLVSLNPAIFGALTHWHDGRTHACCRNYAACPLCHEGVKVRWYGYLPVVEPTSGKLALLELTPESISQSPTLQGPGFSLRGAKVSVWRRGKTKRSPVVVEILVVDKAPPKLPAPIETAAALYRLWGAYPATGPAALNGTTEGGGA